MALPEDKNIRDAAIALLQKRRSVVTDAEMQEALAKQFRLTESDLAKRMKHPLRQHGESTWKHKLRRTKFYLVEGGIIEKGTRGKWTPKAR